MRRQYLHLSAYPCDGCAGPVIAGSLAVRENEISKETDISNARLDLPDVAGGKVRRPSQRARHLMPMEWAPAWRRRGSSPDKLRRGSTHIAERD